MLPERPASRIHRIDLLIALEDRQVRRSHLALPVVVDLDAVVANRVAANRALVARLRRLLLFDLVGAARETDKHQHDANMDDLPAVTALVAPDETDERGQEVCARVLAADAGAPREFLQDRAE